MRKTGYASISQLGRNLTSDSHEEAHRGGGGGASRGTSSSTLRRGYSWSKSSMTWVRSKR